MMSVLVLLLAAPLAAIALILSGKVAPRRAALAASLFNLIVALVLLSSLGIAGSAGGYRHVVDLAWGRLPLLPEIHFHLGMDGISAALVFLAALVTAAAVGVSPADCKRPREFFVYVLLMSLGAIGAFLSLDLFFFYVFHEVALIPTFLLIGIWGTQNRKFASMQLTIYLTLGSLILLAGLLGLVLALPDSARTLQLPQLQSYLAENPLPVDQQWAICGLLLAGFGILVSLFPFHSWAPPGYAAAPPPVAMLHAGVLKKFGLYGLLRVALPLLPQGASDWQPVLLWLLAGNILYIGMAAMAQKELPSLLGFSSVMHMGYLFLGLTAWSALSVSGTVILMVGHGLSAALLFAVAGEVAQRTGENRMAELGGLAQRMPFLAVVFVIASMASAGLPGLLNFAGEIGIFFGAWKQGLGLAVIVALWGVVITSVYQLRAVRAVFFGALPEKFQSLSEATHFSGRWPYVLLATALLVLGLCPCLLLAVIKPAVLTLMGVSGGGR